MEQEQKKNWKIWIYLIPVYLAAAFPVARWAIKANSGDLPLSKDEYKMFNSEESGPVKKRRPAQRIPDLKDSALGVRYKLIAGPRPAQGGGGITPEELRAIGFTEGRLTRAVGIALKKPEAIRALFNNNSMVEGFMARQQVRSAAADQRVLADLVNEEGLISEFAANSVTQAALKEPRIVDAIISSLLTDTLLKTPAGQSLLKDPAALESIIDSNQALKALILHPNVISALKRNPRTAGVMARIHLKK